MVWGVPSWHVHLKKYLQYIIVLMRVKMNTGRNELAVYACDVPINLSTEYVLPYLGRHQRIACGAYMIKTRLTYLKFTKPPRSGENFDLGEKAKKMHWSNPVR